MLYQIYEKQKNEFHAGSKAREDAHYFLDRMGFRTIKINVITIKKRTLINRIRRYLTPAISWVKALFAVKKNSVIVIQNPFYSKQLFRSNVLTFLKKIKGCRIISLIHDVELLRDGDNVSKYMNEEFEFMKDNSDIFIVHNHSMANEFIKLGFSEDSLVELGLFDYHGELPDKKKGSPKYDVVIAGNLSREKSAYIYRLGELKGDIKIGLYGPNYDGQDIDNIVYEGVFPPEQVPGELNGKFGLIWDGGDLYTCEGDTGRYLKYNDPHKASLYLFSGLPIIVWKQAAIAGFVVDNEVGFTVESLDEIEDKLAGLSEEDYLAMKKNAETLATELSEGNNLNCVIEDSLKRIEKMRDRK